MTILTRENFRGGLWLSYLKQVLLPTLREVKGHHGIGPAAADEIERLMAIEEKHKRMMTMTTMADHRVIAVFAEIAAELERARAKFPGKNVTTLAMVEEVGELAKATFEESRLAVRKEAVQVAVMAIRVVLDGDHTLDQWRKDKGLDPLVAPYG